ncbi:MAG: NADH-quinone oxidoreductase subunit A [Ignavibacteriota bacterium]|jgi:NADH-quinone oxidoreductase subunit A|nr:MAG: NADH-quinone oxidoreductase subunit A [Chlorobiota bacterium]MBE7477394.1 NADH-quinone oxidoreductase subunit A [Ignavibacteriales bacterium]MBL1122795.1 NADH-quinone oxidoreductase subunit A [Ignavibacteriota bacterium]MBV6421986.1 NADH-quinone oxidoreductase subunit A [Ignavibacteriaceae bacterium]MCE7855816.1 NADH-quinone oxidoreductase subunit A [Ignavibacteria bacterium CHB3]MEB2296312.1 NADH-quinone oxidoreductase subunit A [Ignavibacteria bacterium]
MIIDYIPLFLVLAVALIFGVVVVWSSTLIGPQRPNKQKTSTYESGMQPVGTTKQRISIKYYLVGMFFIIFDLEVIFIYPWAVQFRKLFGEFGISVFVSMLLFLIVLELGYLYAYKKGGFNWD